MNVLIQGASRGIGLALTNEFILRGASHVIATHRGPAPRLDTLRKQSGGALELMRLDLTDEASIAEAATQVTARVGHLDLLINVAGLLHGEGFGPERRIEEIDSEALARSFAVNATGPALVAKHFHALLTHGSRSVFASMSARVGSISDNRLGGWYAYRASKAAQNMLTKTLSIELARRAPNLICVALHPGTVDTELSKPFQRNVPPGKLFEVGRAATQLASVVDALTIADTGCFFDWKGDPIPW